jgi:cephalosporin hydroxylase
MSTSLKNILDGKMTDKDTLHSYGDVYTELLEPKRNTAKNILEIGICYGGSILTWYEYFTHAVVHGMDIMYNQYVLALPKHNRINLIFEDAYNVQVFERMSDNIYDVIIDDGPHTLESMKFAAANYSKLLTDDGIMIIEDVQSDSWIDEIRMSFPEEFRDKVVVYDLRSIKGRYDDILVVLKK